MGGLTSAGRVLASMERYDVAHGAWRKAAQLAVVRDQLGLCKLNGELYAISGRDAHEIFAIVERYDPSDDTWSAAPALSCPGRGMLTVPVSWGTRCTCSAVSRRSKEKSSKR